MIRKVGAGSGRQGHRAAQAGGAGGGADRRQVRASRHRPSRRHGQTLSREERDEILGHTDYFVEFGKFTLGVIENVVLKNPAYVEMILSDTFTHRTYSMGTVDANNKVNFYDGMVRVVDPGRKGIRQVPPARLPRGAGRARGAVVVPEVPLPQKVGWKGFVDGKDSGVYRATPLARLNAADGMATPLAQQEYERMYSTLGGKPVHHTLATHWARVIELMYAAERAWELARDEEILSDKIRNIPTAKPDEGVGCVEAPRGTLYHHYVADERGILQRVNLIVGTTNNHAPIAMSIRKAAFGLIKPGHGDYRRPCSTASKMAFRAYDPCFACATHSLPGAMPLEVEGHRLRMEPASHTAGAPETHATGVIVGVGNTLCGDDGAGPTVARRVWELLPERENWETLELCCSALDVIERLAGYRRAVIVDALVDWDAPAGTVVRVSMDESAGDPSAPVARARLPRRASAGARGGAAPARVHCLLWHRGPRDPWSSARSFPQPSRPASRPIARQIVEDLTGGDAKRRGALLVRFPHRPPGP